ncbi:MAG: TonB-dependent receptor [Bacteroidota bacterium]
MLRKAFHVFPLSFSNQPQVWSAWLFLLFGSSSLSAQEATDTLYQLSPVQIEGTTLRADDEAFHTQTWSAAELRAEGAARVSDLLAQNSGIFVKQYGPGTLATTSLRGGSAGHTAVTWNGLPITSPMLGQLDFSLLPVGFVDEMRLEYGGNTALWGSGAIGGTLHLNNQVNFLPGMQVQARGTVGSWGMQDQFVSLQAASTHFASRTRVFRQRSRNDFTYQAFPGGPIQRLSHAAVAQTGALQEFFWQPKKDQRLSLHIWWQDVFREIPPTLVQTRSQATQEDQALRISFNWHKVLEKGALKVRGGLFREALNYRDEQIRLNSTSSFWTGIAEVERQRFIGKAHQLTLGLNHTWTQAEIAAYQSNPQQHSSAVFLAHSWQKGKWKWNGSLRQGIIDGKILPLVGSGALRFEVKPSLRLHMQAARNYRVPTFNDRFWNPGGNPDLLPESGWSQEGGFSWQILDKGWKVNYQSIVFNRNIQNWILWSIQEGDFFYSANNIAEVWSRGWEQKLSVEIPSSRSTWAFSASHHLTRSTYQTSLSFPVISEGDQLVYVPVHRLLGNLNYQREKWSLRYMHQFTSSVETLRFTQLPAYHIGHLRAQGIINWRKWSGEVFLAVDNVWNAAYQVIEFRPMPGRTLRVGVSTSFDQANH